MLTNLKPVLVVGGAGYIGSHMVLTLKRAGYFPVVLDNFSKGHRESVRGTECVEGDMADAALLHKLFDTHAFVAVMHFASFIEVAESVLFPAKYYQNNVAGTLQLLDVMLQRGVKPFIFSSSAAVYGNTNATLISEDHALAPVNPYGRSKWMVEEILKDLGKSGDIQYAILRYFNAAGAEPGGTLCEQHHPESHLIPLVLEVAQGLRPCISIFGDDYPTEDGTCVRDYVHVTDICNAHLLAMSALRKSADPIICNLGTGQGHSVLDVIKAARKITGKVIPMEFDSKRKGDPAMLVADAARARSLLRWMPKYPDLETMIAHAWEALQGRFQGASHDDVSFAKFA